MDPIPARYRPQDAFRWFPVHFVCCSYDLLGFHGDNTDPNLVEDVSSFQELSVVTANFAVDPSLEVTKQCHHIKKLM